MLNFPAETFWFLVPWPFIWLSFGIVMYFIQKRDDKLEDSFLAKTDDKELK